MADQQLSTDPFAPRLERALRRAVPSFVHRLNNALAAVTGFSSVAVLSGGGLAPDRTKVVSEQAERARTLARALSEIAKPTEGPVEPQDLVEWLQRHEDFLDGCVEAYPATVALEFELAAAPVRTAIRPLLQSLFVALIEAADEGARELVVAVRTSAEPGGVANAVQLSVRGSRLGAPLPAALVERCGAHASSNGALQILTFETLAPVRAAAARGAAPVVLLVERDPFLRELVEQVLAEHGYSVSAHERLDGCGGVTSAPAVLLLDAIAASTPSARTLLERLGPKIPVAVMGRPTAPVDAAWPHLAKPFRPGELIECVASLAKAR
jgi:hypothetical protein